MKRQRRDVAPSDLPWLEPRRSVPLLIGVTIGACAIGGVLWIDHWEGQETGIPPKCRVYEEAGRYFAEGSETSMELSRETYLLRKRAKQDQMIVGFGGFGLALAAVVVLGRIWRW